MPTEATTQAPATTEAPKVTFTPEQQARIDEIIRESMGRAGGETRRQNEELSTTVNALKAELESAKADLAKAKTPSEKKEAKAELDTLSAQISEMKSVQQQTAAEMDRLKQLAAAKEKDVEAARKETISVRKQNAIQNSAASQGFVDAEVVAALTANQIQFDQEKNRFFVIGENGQPRLNSAYEPMTLDEFYADYATKKPYLVRADIKAGAGSSEAQRSALSAAGKYTPEMLFGPKADAVLANKVALQDIKQYRRLKEQAREQKLIG